jgi:hypothetical protein
MPSAARRKVIFCSSIGGHEAVMQHDTLLAKALKLRDCDVEFLLCDAALDACEACSIYSIRPEHFLNDGHRQELCGRCFKFGSREIEKTAFRLHRYGDFLQAGDKEKIAALSAPVKNLEEGKNFVFEGVRVGEEAYAGTLRFYARGDVEKEPEGFKVFQRFLKAAITAAIVTRRLLSARKPDVLVFHHGVYVPQGVIGQVARDMDIAVVNWVVGYRKGSFVYSHDDTYHRTMIDEPVSDWENMEWTPQMDAELEDYLVSRQTSSRDWIKFHKEPVTEDEEVKAQLALKDQPSVLLLTNVIWDAQLFYKNNCFARLIDWLFYSIDYFAQRPEVNLVIRVHPAEVRGTMLTRQKVMTELAERYPQGLPANIVVIPPESPLSTYTLARICKGGVLIFGTKTGVELAATGTRVVVAGEAWVKGKGFTIDPDSVEAYRAILDSMPFRDALPASLVERARKYAYHYFFRRLLPYSFVKDRADRKTATPTDSKFDKFLAKVLGREAVQPIFVSPYDIDPDEARDLSPGANRSLDIVCEGILEKKGFIYDPKAREN